MSFRAENQAEPIPGYRLLSRLGGGGYGDVWKCEAPGGVHKAIKFVFGNLQSDSVIDGEDDSIRAEQELRSLERIKRIRHPFILALDRYEIIDGQLMIVSELADCSLYDRVRECVANGLPGIPRDELLSYMAETAEALDYMTEKHDLLHLDIKPQNLFLLCNHIKIGDFGLVKDVDGLLANVTGGFTTIYAAPESFDGYVSRFSDQYSLAIVYQELLTGIRPYEGNNARQIMLQHIQGKPNLSSLPEAERPVIERALAKTPNERWPNCMAMVKALQNATLQKPPLTVTTLQKDMSTVLEMPDSTAGGTPAEEPLLDVDGTFSEHNQETTKADPAFVRGGKQRASRPFKKLDPSAIASRLSTPDIDQYQGVLRPTLIIGLGQFGRATVNRIRSELTAQWGSTGFPLLRTWAIDTDSAAPSPRLDSPNTSEDLLVTGLSRPARYIRSRDTLPPVEDWLDTNILYRMPRTLQTNGIRALGRLAFVEHYAAFTSRLERELQELMKPRSKLESCKITNQTLRNNRPQVFLVAHLGGGTGSGMFLDCAYVTRHIMRKLKIEAPEVTGVFFVPNPQAMETPDLAEVNAVAAFHELYHFQQTESPFSVLYRSKSEPLTDSEAPFSHCLFFETPQRPSQNQGKKDDPARKVIARAAQSLIEQSTSSVGRLAESNREAIPHLSTYQAIGLKIITSPRKALLKTAGKLVFNQVLDYWCRPITAKQHLSIQQPIEDFFVKENCHPEGMFAYLENTLTLTLDKSCEQQILELIKPYNKPIRTFLPTAIEIQKTLDKILDKLGNVQNDDSVSLSMLSPMATQWTRLLRDVGKEKIRPIKPRLKQIIFQQLDKPGLRISGAEVTHRSIIKLLEGWLSQQEELTKSSQQDFALAVSHLREDALEYDRIRNIAKFRWPRMMQTPGERLLAAYRAKYKALIHERLVNFYDLMRTMCSDLFQELLRCRANILELRNDQAAIEKSLNVGELSSPFAKKLFLPSGCTDLMQVAKEISTGISPESLDQVDDFLAERLAGTFPKLGDVCQASGEMLQSVRSLIESELANYLKKNTIIPDPATALLQKEGDLTPLMEQLYQEAAPFLVLNHSTNAQEFVTVMIPDSPEGKTLQQRLNQLLPELHVASIAASDQLVMYRAIHGFELSEMAVLSEAGQEAYENAMNIEHFTPHARQDISDWSNPMFVEKPALNLPG